MALTKHPGTIRIHDVGLTLSPAGGALSPEALEEWTFEVERVLYEHACGEDFGAAVACSFDPPEIEIDLSIPAVSASLVNRRVSQILETLEEHLKISLSLSEQKVEREGGAAGSRAA